ncbi:MAG: recombination mediator RecR [Planctomycetaceae bacterium]|jgi:recombination protein RecR|nr:recombination mediator RecR [Planctomycetaceae bacterium]
MSELTESVQQMISEFAKLPGIGRKSAERIAYYLLRANKGEAMLLANAIRVVKDKVRYCANCFNLAETDICEVCRDTSRDQSVICVVEQPRDLNVIEQTGKYNGLYHVLLGRIAPLDHVEADQLSIDALVRRVKKGNFAEIILGTNPTVEGDGTALYIMNRLNDVKIKITRLARGITTGNELQFANKEMLADAITERQTVK